MRKHCSTVVARSFLLASSFVCCAASAATIELPDGTVIQGEVKSLHDGVYTIETASVGTLHVRAQDVASIDQGGRPPSASGAALIKNPKVRAIIDALH
jgi:hypothetical protein